MYPTEKHAGVLFHQSNRVRRGKILYGAPTPDELREPARGL